MPALDPGIHDELQLEKFYERLSLQRRSRACRAIVREATPSLDGYARQ
jgi:hypothetical protein